MLKLKDVKINKSESGFLPHQMTAYVVHNNVCGHWGATTL